MANTSRSVIYNVMLYCALPCSCKSTQNNSQTARNHALYLLHHNVNISVYQEFGSKQIAKNLSNALWLDYEIIDVNNPNHTWYISDFSAGYYLYPFDVWDVLIN